MITIRTVASSSSWSGWSSQSSCRNFYYYQCQLPLPHCIVGPQLVTRFLFAQWLVHQHHHHHHRNHCDHHHRHDLYDHRHYFNIRAINIVNISNNVVIKLWSLWPCIIRNHNSHKVLLISWSWCIQSCWCTRSVIENDIQCACTSACERNNVIILMFRNTSLLTQLAQYWDIANDTKRKW